jgi:hypothetical protein
MASWVEVQERLRRTYELNVDDPDEVALTLERKEGDKTRAQRVMLRHYHAWGREMLEIRSAFGELGDYDPVALLTENLNLPLGAIAAHGKFLVLVDRACLDDLPVEGVLFLMTRISMLADVLEGRSGTDRF